MKILLHMCCGPCACYPVKRLRELGFEPVGYFFNPNIHPYKEFMHRLETAKEYAEKVHMELIVDDNYQLREFLAKLSQRKSLRKTAAAGCATAGGWIRRQSLPKPTALRPLPHLCS